MGFEASGLLARKSLATIAPQAMLLSLTIYSCYRRILSLPLYPDPFVDEGFW